MTNTNSTSSVVVPEFLYILPSPEIMDGKLMYFGPFQDISDALGFFDRMRSNFAGENITRYDVEATVNYGVSDAPGDLSLCSLEIVDNDDLVCDAAVYTESAFCELTGITPDLLRKPHASMIH